MDWDEQGVHYFKLKYLQNSTQGAQKVAQIILKHAPFAMYDIVSENRILIHNKNDVFYHLLKQ